MIIKSSLGLSFGVVFSVLLFKRKAWPAWIGLGFGAGRAWEEADGTFISLIHSVHGHLEGHLVKLELRVTIR